MHNKISPCATRNIILFRAQKYTCGRLFILFFSTKKCIQKYQRGLLEPTCGRESLQLVIERNTKHLGTQQTQKYFLLHKTHDVLYKK